MTKLRFKPGDTVCRTRYLNGVKKSVEFKIIRFALKRGFDYTVELPDGIQFDMLDSELELISTTTESNSGAEPGFDQDIWDRAFFAAISGQQPFAADAEAIVERAENIADKACEVRSAKIRERRER